MAKTNNSFLPTIQQFSNFLGQYMQQQVGLAEKTYELNKRNEGQQFIGVFGQKIRESKTLEELAKVMTEATQYAGQKGLTPHLSVLGSLAQSQGTGIKLEQDKAKAGLFVDTLKNNYGDATAPWNGNKAVKVSDIITDIQNKYVDDPTLQVQALDQVAKSINKIDSGVFRNAKDGSYSIVQGTKSATGEQVATGQPIKVAFDKQGRPFMDTNANNQLDPNEQYANVTDAEKISQLQTQVEDKKLSKDRYNAQFGSVTRREMFNPETNKFTTVLENNYSGKLYEIDASGNQGKQLTGSGWISRESYNAVTKNSAAGVNVVAKQVKLDKNSLLNVLGTDSAGDNSNSFFRAYNYKTDEGYPSIDRIIKKLDEIQIKGGSEYQKYKEQGVYDAMNKYLQSEITYEQSYKRYTEAFKNPPTADDGTVMPAPGRTSKQTNEPQIVQQNGLFKIYDKNGNVIGTTFSKEKADSIYTSIKGK